jgi:serine/threonine-protein kinase
MRIDAERWELIQRLFHEALALPETERATFVERACASDPRLLDQVRALLAADARHSSVLDRGLGDVARDVFDGSVPNVASVGPYRIRSVLGRGGMGVVYLAEREDLGTRVAIKMLRDASLSPFRRERFALEQRTLAQLNHPSIARLYDADTLPDHTPYFVMEYVEGVPLTAHCAKTGASLGDRLRLFGEVCAAVQYAHRYAVVHRDLKPSNILVSADGAVKLLDFGIAKQLEELDTPAHQTSTGLRLMTPAYAAPEQITGEPVGVYTDVYALGVVLYELLTGKLPFDLSDRTPGQVETMLLEQEPEKPSSVVRRGVEGATPPAVRPGAWADLDVLCLTAMHKDPHRRYQTVEALARDVAHFLASEPLEARPDTVRYRAGKFLRRNRRPLAAAAAVLTLLIASTAYYTVNLASARDAALADAARTQRIQAFTLNLFQGDAQVGPADTLRVVSLVQRGVQEAGVLDGERAVQAELFETLGGIYRKLGEFERADSLLDAALSGRRALYGEDHPDVAKSLIALGLLRTDQGRLDEAESAIREGRAIMRRHLPGTHATAVRASTAHARALYEKGDYEAAIAVLDSTLAGSVGDVASVELSESLGELANAHYSNGNYPASDSLNRLVLAMDRRIYGERHPYVGDALINLGAIQQALGNYESAEAMHREGLEIMEAYYGPDHYRTAAAQRMLGQTLVFEEKYDEAVVLLHRALEVRRRVFGPTHPNVATTLNELGGIALNRDDFAGAIDFYTQAVEIYRAAYADRHSFIGIAMANLASVHMTAGDYARAEPIFREAVRRLEDTLPPDHLQTAITRIKLGHTLANLGRYEEAEPILLVGYETLRAQSNPSVSWLRSARRTLVTVYEALRRPEQVTRFRAEMAADSVAAAAR